MIIKDMAKLKFLKGVDMMPDLPIKFSMLPLLLLLQFFAIWFVTHRAKKQGQITKSGSMLMTILLILLVGWTVISSYLAINHTYLSNWFLASWPAFWVTFVAVTLVMIPLVVSAGARDVLRSIIDATPLHWMIGFQALRIFALGGIIKSLNGDFALYYGLYIGIPDFIFGLSALVMFWLVSSNRVGYKTVTVWNLLGAMIIVPFGMVLLQMGLAGPWQTFTDAPTITTIFEFPMALAPTVVVPIFVMTNLLVALRLVERLMAGENSPARPRAGSSSQRWEQPQSVPVPWEIRKSW